MKQVEQPRVADFVLRNAPQRLVKGLGVLERLQVPVHDKYSFECQLEEMSEEADDDTKRMIGTIVARFGAQDFPLLSVESAFEKYWDKFQPFPLPSTLLPPMFELPEEFRFEPPICEIYRDTFENEPFGASAADCACRTYNEARLEGFNHLQSVIIGHFAGRRAVRNAGRCEL